MTPNLALALEDFVPVILTLFSLAWITRIVLDMDQRSGWVSLVGSALVILGGFFKATSKLLWVFTGELILWMDNSLFALMAPGFAFLAWGVWTGQKNLFKGIETRNVLNAPIAFSVLLIGGISILRSGDESRTWFLVLLTLVVLMSSLVLVLLTRHAWKFKRKDTAFLFVFYLAMTLLLNGLARTPSPTIAVEWTKQLLNTFATMILAVASWQLWRTTREKNLQQTP